MKKNKTSEDTTRFVINTLILSLGIGGLLISNRILHDKKCEKLEQLALASDNKSWDDDYEEDEDED